MTDFSGRLPVETVPDPICPADGVIVRIRACGVCRSDHHAWKGADPDVTLPHVMGHELAGDVVEVGRDCHRFGKGDRVTAPFILGCGACPTCLGGDATCCDAQEVIGFTQWGAFAELIAIPRADFNLVPLPETVGYTAAAGMGCRVTTAFKAVVDRGAVQPGEWMAVHGCGGVGLSAVMIGAAVGARVLAVDVNPEALELARSFGASDTLLAGEADVGEAVREMTGGGAHVSIEALGRTATFHNSLASLRKLGRHVQIGMPTGAHSTPPLPLLGLVYARQLTLHGTRGIGPNRFAALFEMIAAERLDPGRLVTETIPLSGVHAALSAMDRFQKAGVTVVDQLNC
ncbi:MAG: alcohol dehydrogenase catalytic domain-containing protein [Pseudomonadota bacterium]